MQLRRESTACAKARGGAQHAVRVRELLALWCSWSTGHGTRGALGQSCRNGLGRSPRPSMPGSSTFLWGGDWCHSFSEGDKLGYHGCSGERTPSCFPRWLDTWPDPGMWQASFVMWGRKAWS